jgi:hypothetical protein
VLKVASLVSVALGRVLQALRLVTVLLGRRMLSVGSGTLSVDVILDVPDRFTEPAGIGPPSLTCG